MTLTHHVDFTKRCRDGGLVPRLSLHLYSPTGAQGHNSQYASVQRESLGTRL